MLACRRCCRGRSRGGRVVGGRCGWGARLGFFPLQHIGMAARELGDGGIGRLPGHAGLLHAAAGGQGQVLQRPAGGCGLQPVRQAGRRGRLCAWGCGRMVGRGGVSFAARGSDMGETAEWQTTQAAQGAPWLCSQPEADCAPGAAHRSAAVSAACRSVPSEGAEWCGATASRSACSVWCPCGPCAAPWESACTALAREEEGEGLPWSMPGMLWCTAAVLAPMAGKVPMAMASPARPRRASRTTRKKDSMRRMQGMIPPTSGSSTVGVIGAVGRGRTAKMGRGARCGMPGPAKGGGPSAYLVRISLPSLVACRR